MSNILGADEVHLSSLINIKLIFCPNTIGCLVILRLIYEFKEFS